MPLTLVLGPANSAKAGEVLGAFADAAPRGALLVVPTGADAEHYSRELAQQGCVLRSVLTFGGLASEIARRVDYDGRRLTDLQRERVLRGALRGARLRVLDEVAGTPGFADAAVQLVAELERSMVGAPRFAAALAAWAREDPRREPYAHDVGSIYLAYARELERLGRVDRELFTWQALDALRKAPGRWGSDPVFFYGFDDLHELERDAVETLARIVGAEVTVSLTFEPGRSALSARAGLVAELRGLAGRVLELPALDEYYSPASRVALHHLERSLFELRPAPARLDPGQAVRLLEAGGELAEAELVAAEVSALLRAGTPAEQIVIVYRRLPGALREALARTFARYEIPLALAQHVGFGQTALGRGVLGLARCALDGELATAADVLDYVRTPGLLRHPEVVDELEVKIRRQALCTAAQARDALSFELGEIDELRTARDQLAELVCQARRLLAAPFRQQARVLTTDELLDASALAALARCQAELAELAEAPSGSELVELLEELEVESPPPGSPDAVQVSEPLAVRARRFAVVFVCGLQEGQFPWTPPPDPFLPDERRRELAAASGLRLRLHEDVLDRERYLFYASVSRATERVFLSYRSSDEEGNIALPSPFIEDVAEVLDPQWRARRRRRLLADVTWSPDEAPTARERAKALAARGGEPGAEVDGGPVRRLGPDALRHVRHTEVLSAGGLESYAACHMKWLVERELAPAALEPEPEPLARGSWVHRVLEQVLARLGGPITPESLPDAIRLLDETMTEVSPRIASGRSAALRHAVADTIAADLRRYLAQEASCGNGWPARELELRFGFEGEEGSLPPLVLERDGQQVALRGAIDRVDVEPGGRRAIVRDYKTGSVRSVQQGNRWRTDQQLQVALYMIAVRELLGLEPVAGLYQPLIGKDLRPRGVYLEGAPVQSGLFAGDGRDPDSLRAELDDAAERALALAAELRAGDLEPCPQTCSREGCRYPGICRGQ
jgi:ATP-dependent helicase/DNAse subunit B